LRGHEHKPRLWLRPEQACIGDGPNPTAAQGATKIERKAIAGSLSRSGGGELPASRHFLATM
jgi:hypothetical protein